MRKLASYLTLCVGLTLAGIGGVSMAGPSDEDEDEDEASENSGKGKGNGKGQGQSNLIERRQNNRFRAVLSGYQEVPAILTTGSGTFQSTLDGQLLNFELTYKDLRGGAVAAAHIHFGQRGVAVPGNILADLCGGSKPACTVAGVTVKGTIQASDVKAITAQGVTAGKLEDLIAVMRSGNAYVNVHTPNFASGEIRGQIGSGWGLN